jgi:ketosteroid isomerase-like protein
MTFDEKRVREILRRAWSPRSSSRWSPENPGLGQCSPTALVVQDCFGGTLLKTCIGAAWHFYNCIEGQWVDYTADQFAASPSYGHVPATRDEVRGDCTLEQYTTLKQHFETHSAEREIPREIGRLALQPAELHTLFKEAFNRGDVDALMALYESTATLVVNGEAVTGTDRIRAATEVWLAAKGQMRLETCTVVESPDGLAVLHGSWMVESAISTSHGVSTEVARRRADGTWRFVIDSPHGLR